MKPETFWRKRLSRCVTRALSVRLGTFVWLRGCPRSWVAHYYSRIVFHLLAFFFLQREWSHIRPREIINTKEEKRKTRPRCMPAAVAVSPEWPLRIRLWPRMSLTSSATLSRSNRFWACTGSCAICSGWNPLTSRSSTRNSRSVCRRWRFLNSHLDQDSFPRRRVTDDGVLTLF